MTDAASAANTPPRPTRETYEQFQRAYETLNTGLFDGSLPNCLITLQRRTGTYGYFSRARFVREDGEISDEIALNPMHFEDRPVPEVLATLAHEMVHLWQHHHGKPGRGRYHNRQWADKMKAIGLQPSAGEGAAATEGEDAPKETGENVQQHITEGGPFDELVGKLLSRGFTITWKERREEDGDEETGETGKKSSGASKSGKRVRYDCPECDQRAWAKFDARLVSGDHMIPMQPSG